MHDVLDSKLVTVETNKDMVENELRTLVEKEGFTKDQVETIMSITKSIGYNKRLKADWNLDHYPKEYKAVQDADLLDAIGAIGIGRTYSYGGKRLRPLFGVAECCCVDHISHEFYVGKRSLEGSSVAGGPTNSTMEHFFDKLLRIEPLFITTKGKELGRKRHERMMTFIEGLQEELMEASDPNDSSIVRENEVIQEFLAKRKRSVSCS